jgi:hypothetical protein
VYDSREAAMPTRCDTSYSPRENPYFSVCLPIQFVASPKLQARFKPCKSQHQCTAVRSSVRSSVNCMYVCICLVMSQRDDHVVVRIDRPRARSMRDNFPFPRKYTFYYETVLCETRLWKMTPDDPVQQASRTHEIESGGKNSAPIHGKK